MVRAPQTSMYIKQVVCSLCVYNAMVETETKPNPFFFSQPQTSHHHHPPTTTQIFLIVQLKDLSVATRFSFNQYTDQLQMQFNVLNVGQ